MKAFETIDNGYKCRKDFIGYGWHIEGNNLCNNYENYLIEVDSTIWDSVSWIDEIITKLKYGNTLCLGFRTSKDAKQWATNHAK